MFKLIFKEFKLDTLLFIIIALIDTFLKVSTVVLFIPLLEYMQSSENINSSLWYWQLITQSLNFIGIQLSFTSLALFILAMIILNEVVLFFKNSYLKYFPEKIQIFLRKVLIQQLFLKEYSFLINFSNSKLITFVTTHLNIVATLYTNLIMQISNVIQLIFLLGFLITMSLELTVFVMMSLALVITITVIKLKVLKQFASKANENIKLVSQLVSEQILFLKYVFVSKVKPQSLNKLLDKLSIILKYRYKIVLSTTGVEFVVNSIYYSIAIGIVVYAFEVIKLPFNEIIIYLYVLANRVKPIVADFPKKYSHFRSSLPVIEDVSEFFVDKIKESNIKKINNQINIDKIEVSSLSFSFTDKPMINNKSLTMVNGKMYSIIGPSGMGKTTFIDLILGLLKPTAGKVRFIDNFKSSISLEEINIFYMTQSPAIITGTVKENLTYINKNSELSDSMLWAALDNVNLKQTFLDRDGLETKISENAINLSMGQKQRLALARLFLADYHLIVLDEFSNGIDYESKALIISSINKAVKNKICISISHDKDVISTADEIIDFSKDKIEEFTKTKC